MACLSRSRGGHMRAFIYTQAARPSNYLAFAHSPQNSCRHGALRHIFHDLLATERNGTNERAAHIFLPTAHVRNGPGGHFADGERTNERSENAENVASRRLAHVPPAKNPELEPELAATCILFGFALRPRRRSFMNGHTHEAVAAQLAAAGATYDPL